jgi:predicted phage terminase large subunit-like protein
VWYLANYPTASIIAASHTTELSERWGRRGRNAILEHGAMLDIGLRADSQAAGRWDLVDGGGYLASGVGQAILGFRADLVIIDDPIRSREDAQSETIRRTQWEWFNGDVRTRLKPDARMAIISTRWHEDDLVGRLLADAEKGGDQWQVLSLPAIAEEHDPLGRSPGQWLWDEDPSYPYGQQLRQQHSVQSPMNWAALFQQRPAPETGDYFQREWLKPYEVMPDIKTLRTYGASDYAVTSGGGDWTVHVIVGIDPQWKLYLLDMWRGQTSPDIWVEKQLDLQARWKCLDWAEETGQIKASVGPFRDRRMHERNVPLFSRQFPTRGDKAVRAQSIRGRMAMSGLYVPTKAPWYPIFQAELFSFPVGRHDDIVDALGLIGQLLDVAVAGQRPEKPKEGIIYDESTDPYRSADADMMRILEIGNDLDYTNALLERNGGDALLDGPNDGYGSWKAW